MSDTPRGPGWWQATDGRFYAPEQHPSYVPPEAPPPPVGVQGWSAPPTAVTDAASWDPTATPTMTPEPGPVPPSTSGLLKWGLILGGLFLVLVIIGAAMGAGEDKTADIAADDTTTTTEARPASTVPPTTKAPTTTEAPTTTAAPTITTTTAPPPPPPPPPTAPPESVSQANAREKAASYLEYTSFSRIGLIKQLEYEGFSNADAVYGTDAQDADWNQQAAGKAASYLEYSSFSRQGLIDQLLYEGFTPEQAEFGANSTGL